MDINLESEVKHSHGKIVLNPDGRPTIPVEDQKTEILAVRVTKEEMNMIKAYAKKRGGVSSVLRILLVNANII